MDTVKRPASAEFYKKALDAEMTHRFAVERVDDKQPWGGKYPDRPAGIIERELGKAKGEAYKGIQCESCLIGALGECALLDPEKTIEQISAEIEAMSPVEIRRKQEILTNAEGYVPDRPGDEYIEFEKERVGEELAAIREEEKQRGVSDEVLNDIGITEVEA